MENEEFSRVLELLESSGVEEAQKALGELPDCPRKNYVQAKIFEKKRWFNEARKQLELALMAEPENQEYINALDEINLIAEKSKLKDVKKSGADTSQMGECCCECTGEMCILGLCHSICDGCG